MSILEKSLLACLWKSKESGHVVKCLQLVTIIIDLIMVIIVMMITTTMMTMMMIGDFFDYHWLDDGDDDYNNNDDDGDGDSIFESATCVQSAQPISLSERPRKKT